MPRKLLLYLYSTPNIAGSLLGLAGLGLFFAGLIKSYWVFIVIGLYLVGYSVTPKSKSIVLQLNHEFDAETLRRSLDQLISKIRKRVSAEVLAKVESIKESIITVLPRLSEYESSAYDIHVIRQTALDYLPEMLETYLKLPTAYARLHTVRDGKTSKDLLLEQLEILDAEMQKVVIDLHKNDTQALITHGRFLKNKFRKGSEDWLS
jgi:hypothetical protein